MPKKHRLSKISRDSIIEKESNDEWYKVHFEDEKTAKYYCQLVKKLLQDQFPEGMKRLNIRAETNRGCTTYRFVLTKRTVHSNDNTDSNYQ